MLILARKAGQAVVIGEEVEVTVLEVRGDLVRLGIRAPRSVSVHRKEVYLQIVEANQIASLGTDVENVARAEQMRPPGGPAASQPPGVCLTSRRSTA